MPAVVQRDTQRAETRSTPTRASCYHLVQSHVESVEIEEAIILYTFSHIAVVGKGHLKAC